ncbi:uncharacterized protein LOC128955946 [Oppia nitens]|uniref:uncharacterized protein LOC128955946 n=1 Tax=Oppia nitens TaxID=1686743 RepID=UPI0023DC0F13|nr:uncharacterized protein LOC128955946 [Oppia nitens]
MISRRKIISRSHDVLNDGNSNVNLYEFDDNYWISKDKLFRDHIQEILQKWDQIDDEIWAKIICMERNRRVAKAYARAQVLSINGSNTGFDGYRIGLNGFQNPKRDPITEDVMKYIGSGAKIKIDDDGNIMIKRVGKCNVYVNGNGLNGTVSTGKGGQSSMTGIEFDKSHKLFDMKTFQTDVFNELRNSYPDRRKLEIQCISCMAFVRQETNVLDQPIWMMLINIVALDMLKTKFPIPVPQTPKFITIFEQSVNDRELPKANYMNTSNCLTNKRYSQQFLSTFNRQDKTPTSRSTGATTDYSLMSSSLSSTSSSTAAQQQPTSRRDHLNRVLTENENFSPNIYRNRCLDDLYYCGLEARVPNYGRQRTSLAICANNSNVDLRKYFNSSLQLSSLDNSGGNDMPSIRPIRAPIPEFDPIDDCPESMDMFAV